MTHADHKRPSGLDGEARAELLCYLVVSQLVGRVRTSSWLQTDHLVESTRIWSDGNGAQTNWSESVRLGALSRQLAETVWAIEPLRDEEVLSGMFTEAWRLDFRSPIVNGVYEVCVVRLMTWEYEA
ncbi:hypothetical protein [Paraburkholderia terrae]